MAFVTRKNQIANYVYSYNYNARIQIKNKLYYYKQIIIL